ncbi:MAG: DNA-directed RNA polymerase subunit omega [Thermoleophilia bacterium]
MLYGRQLDQALEHVDGSRYALVHAVSKRARQITLWLTADPAELRAESAPPPAAGELVTRDPVALSEAEILQGEVLVKWDPEGRGEELGDGSTTVDELDESILLESLNDDDDDADLNGEDGTEVTPALAQVLDGEATTEDDDADDDEEDDEGGDDDDDLAGLDESEVSLDEMRDDEAAEDEALDEDDD